MQPNWKVDGETPKSKLKYVTEDIHTHSMAVLVGVCCAGGVPAGRCRLFRVVFSVLRLCAGNGGLHSLSPLLSATAAFVLLLIAATPDTSKYPKYLSTTIRYYRYSVTSEILSQALPRRCDGKDFRDGAAFVMFHSSECGCFVCNT